jgi:thymidylate synthase (FAD)
MIPTREQLSALSSPRSVHKHGYVRLTRVMAEVSDEGLTPTSDLSVINDARASFAKSASDFGEKERKTMRTLDEGGHTSPFRGTVIQIEVSCPLMIARQWWKYVVGSDFDETAVGGMSYRDAFSAWNEVSRRYVTRNPTMFRPGVGGWRAAAETRKQGSAGTVDVLRGLRWERKLRDFQETAGALYADAIADGIAGEQARLFLTAYGLFVTFRWTASLQAVVHLLNQRLGHDAQNEFGDYAREVLPICYLLYPEAVRALLLPEHRPLLDRIDGKRDEEYLNRPWDDFPAKTGCAVFGYIFREPGDRRLILVPAPLHDSWLDLIEPYESERMKVYGFRDYIELSCYIARQGNTEPEEEIESIYLIRQTDGIDAGSMAFPEEFAFRYNVAGSHKDTALALFALKSEVNKIVGV